ncbi:hypothetical protein [Gillisia limnaea]|uniref:Uncharacterized protein n=1 Tax=Gillisia limnaea (strain DSM 15749 / LMG 21470 / R-8282) TaxID=865937 RepID=H2BX95_GILLR|nr:hypothetical protein [Gillisia limnaea]EHQ03085.1 hypothetical protein Gilli_2459 [Gillisia limnaea DSM 15749]
MEVRDTFKIATFIIFLFSYLLAVMMLMNFGNTRYLIFLGVACSLSLILFLLSHVIFIKK